jgi:hypothetical protein
VTNTGQTCWSKQVSHGQSVTRCFCQVSKTSITHLQTRSKQYRGLRMPSAMPMTITCNHHYLVHRHRPCCSGEDRIHHHCPTIQSHHLVQGDIAELICVIIHLTHFEITPRLLDPSLGPLCEARLTQLVTFSWTTACLRLRSR